MKKILVTVLALVVLSFASVSVYAEGTGDPNADPSDLPEVVQEGGITTEESEQIQEEALEEAENAEKKDDTESFLTGAGVGASLGLIIGGVFTWLLKDKIA